MNKNRVCALAVCVVLLGGCASAQRGAIPVVDAGGPLSAGGASSSIPDGQAVEQDSGVVVMVPGGSSSAPIQTFPAPSGSAVTAQPVMSGSEPLPVGGYGMPVVPSSAPVSGIPSGGNLSADEQLDGPVLALLTTAQQQQGSGDLNGAASSLERAQRIAPREPQVLYRLAEVRLAQGDPAQAEQLARRGLTYAGGRPQLQASLWELIARAREQQGDPQGAAQARERARVTL
ncbi:tetratricopeptide repeat protein [Pseudomonas pohangensis]|uniref:tetratricopeptide repeat protein n=1 Tax=Pseudomonas pohangensis TaxID=364197 RepID=UPI000A4194AC|nr:tetratricopeptide repeat protein [Pseudomonas pohangensis]